MLQQWVCLPMLLKWQTNNSFLSDLKKYGWLEVNLDPNDSRIRVYKLKEPNNAVKEMEGGS